MIFDKIYRGQTIMIKYTGVIFEKFLHPPLASIRMADKNISFLYNSSPSHRLCFLNKIFHISAFVLEWPLGNEEEKRKRGDFENQ